jgi:small subunit ribosomal protein S20
LPNTKSAIKMMRVAERRRVRNKSVRSSVRTFVKKAEQAIGESSEITAEALRAAVRALDKAATKGIIHRNNAARHKSRLMKKVHAASAS